MAETRTEYVVQHKTDFGNWADVEKCTDAERAAVHLRWRQAKWQGKVYRAVVREIRERVLE